MRTSKLCMCQVNFSLILCSMVPMRHGKEFGRQTAMVFDIVTMPITSTYHMLFVHTMPFSSFRATPIITNLYAWQSKITTFNEVDGRGLRSGPSNLSYIQPPCMAIQNHHIQRGGWARRARTLGLPKKPSGPRKTTKAELTAMKSAFHRPLTKRSDL